MNSDTIIDSNFKTTIELLNKNEIPYWVCHGSLLGIVREGNLISWDHDIDIAIFKSKVDIEKLKRLFVNEGFQDRGGSFENTIHLKKKGGKHLDINLYHKVYSDPLNNEYGVFYQIPKNFILFRVLHVACDDHDYDGKYTNIVKCLRFFKFCFLPIKQFLDKWQLTYNLMGYSMPVKFLNEFTYFKINELDIRIPKHSIEICELIYGKDWKKPKKDFNWKSDSKATKKI